MYFYVLQAMEKSSLLKKEKRRKYNAEWMAKRRIKMKKIALRSNLPHSKFDCSLNEVCNSFSIFTAQCALLQNLKGTKIHTGCDS